MEQQPTMISVIGSPGSGKSTFARGVVTSPEYRGHSAHISLGQEVRDIRAGHIDSPVAQDIDIHYKSHDHYDLLPDYIIDQIAVDALRRYRNTDLDLIMIDGMPRRISQISDLMQLAGASYRLGGVIHTTIDREQALIRLTMRGGRTPNDESVNDEATARHRLELYETNSLSVPLALPYYHIPVFELPTHGPQETTLQRGLGRVAVMMAGHVRHLNEPA